MVSRFTVDEYWVKFSRIVPCSSPEASSGSYRVVFRHDVPKFRSANTRLQTAKHNGCRFMLNGWVAITISQLSRRRCLGVITNHSIVRAKYAHHTRTSKRWAAD